MFALMSGPTSCGFGHSLCLLPLSFRQLFALILLIIFNVGRAERKVRQLFAHMVINNLIALSICASNFFLPSILLPGVKS